MKDNERSLLINGLTHSKSSNVKEYFQRVDDLMFKTLMEEEKEDELISFDIKDVKFNKSNTELNFSILNNIKLLGLLKSPIRHILDKERFFRSGDTLYFYAHGQEQGKELTLFSGVVLKDASYFNKCPEMGIWGQYELTIGIHKWCDIKNVTTDLRMVVAGEGITIVHKVMNDEIHENNINLLLGKYQSTEVKKNESKKNVKFSNEKLDAEQRFTVNHFMNNHITVVEGSSGTGKSTIVKEIVTQSLKFNNSSSQILIVSPSNRKLDQLVEIFKDLPGVLRIISNDKEAEYINNEVHLHTLTHSKLSLNSRKTHNIIQAGKPLQQIKTRKSYDLLEEEWDSISKKIVKESKVILCTNFTSASKYFDDTKKFPVVIIDDAHLSDEVGTLIALMKCWGKCLVLGELGQMNITGKNIPPFLRICEELKSTIKLKNQYRMIPQVSEFPIEQLYKDQEMANKNTIDLPLSVIGIPKAVCFIDHDIKKYIPELSKSFIEPLESATDSTTKYGYINQGEMTLIRKISNQLLTITGSNNDVITKDQISIISPYSAQTQFLVKGLRDDVRKKNMKKNVEEISYDLETSLYKGLDISYIKGMSISTVEAAQSLNNDVVILSTVRSDNKFGMLENKNMVNSALTRANKLLIVLGSKRNLTSKPSIWKEWVNYVQEKGIILVPSQIKNINPDKKIEKKKKKRKSNQK